MFAIQPVPSDLQAARDAVAELGRRYREIVKPILQDLSRNTTTNLPTLLEHLRVQADELSRLATKAAAVVGPIRNLLTIASGKTRSVHEAVIESAQRFSALAATLLGGDSTLTADAVPRSGSPMCQVSIAPLSWEAYCWTGTSFSAGSPTRT